MIRRLIPWPRMSVFLLFMWLLMNQTLAISQLLLGAALALILPVLTAPLHPTKASPKRPLLALRLLAVVLYDSLVSNFVVARIILSSKKKRENSGFLRIPLDMRDPYGLSVLAMIVTGIPGTVWIEIADDQSVLTLHILDLVDEGYWIDTIKNRYERPLMEIFE